MRQTIGLDTEQHREIRRALGWVTFCQVMNRQRAPGAFDLFVGYVNASVFGAQRHQNQERCAATQRGILSDATIP